MEFEWPPPEEELDPRAVEAIQRRAERLRARARASAAAQPGRGATPVVGPAAASAAVAVPGGGAGPRATPAASARQHDRQAPPTPGLASLGLGAPAASGPPTDGLLAPAAARIPTRGLTPSLAASVPAAESLPPRLALVPPVRRGGQRPWTARGAVPSAVGARAAWPVLVLAGLVLVDIGVRVTDFRVPIATTDPARHLAAAEPLSDVVPEPVAEPADDPAPEAAATAGVVLAAAATDRRVLVPEPHPAPSAGTRGVTALAAIDMPRMTAAMPPAAGAARPTTPSPPAATPPAAAPRVVRPPRPPAVLSAETGAGTPGDVAAQRAERPVDDPSPAGHAAPALATAGSSMDLTPSRDGAASAASPAAGPDPSPAAPPPAPSVEADARLRFTLLRYRGAHARLDAAGVKAIYPGVDDRTLVQRFAALQSQNLTFDSCDVRATGAGEARAVCRGTVSVVPRTGRRKVQSSDREWTFGLRQAGQEWLIVEVLER